MRYLLRLIPNTETNALCSVLVVTPHALATSVPGQVRYWFSLKYSSARLQINTYREVVSPSLVPTAAIRACSIPFVTHWSIPLTTFGLSKRVGSFLMTFTISRTLD